MGLEIERKFIVHKLPPKIKNLSHYQIEQRYDTSHKRVRRITRSGKQEFRLTIKKGKGLVRSENEKAIDKKRFDKLWIMGIKEVRKTRYLMPHGKNTIEIDVLKGKNKGLVLAEVEFKTVNEAKRFQPPAWFGKEVTNDAKYTNSNLAIKLKK